MTKRQAGFLIGFLIAWLLWAAGLWVMLGACVAGGIGYAITRVLDGTLDLNDLRDRVNSPSSRS